jgi:hypothetical protein
MSQMSLAVDTPEDVVKAKQIIKTRNLWKKNLLTL